MSIDEYDDLDDENERKMKGKEDKINLRLLQTLHLVCL